MAFEHGVIMECYEAEEGGGDGLNSTTIPCVTGTSKWG